LSNLLGRRIRAEPVAQDPIVFLSEALPERFRRQLNTFARHHDLPRLEVKVAGIDERAVEVPQHAARRRSIHLSNIVSRTVLDIVTTP
jgi:hypothetical protein